MATKKNSSVFVHGLETNNKQRDKQRNLLWHSHWMMVDWLLSDCARLCQLLCTGPAALAVAVCWLGNKGAKQRRDPLCTASRICVIGRLRRWCQLTRSLARALALILPQWMLLYYQSPPFPSDSLLRARNLQSVSIYTQPSPPLSISFFVILRYTP